MRHIVFPDNWVHPLVAWPRASTCGLVVLQAPFLPLHYVRVENLESSLLFGKTLNGCCVSNTDTQAHYSRALAGTNLHTAMLDFFRSFSVFGPYRTSPGGLTRFLRVASRSRPFIAWPRSDRGPWWEFDVGFTGSHASFFPGPSSSAVAPQCRP
jgi:hypothetical protein